MINNGTTAEALLIGDSQPLAEVRRLVRQVAPAAASVLIMGPSGSGKEMVARAIHGESTRAAKPFVAVNCGAIPRDLLESELFGHEKGAFTGANALRRGRFEDANGGTLFLDEIGDMPADMQVKLLRVLEERSITRIGGRELIPVDVRIVSATHRDIAASIERQSFREDLFYRLAVFPITLPSLYDRPDDLPLLVSHFLDRFADPEQRVEFSAAALLHMTAHDWPGNVRELRNVVERAAILYPGKAIGPDEIDLLVARKASLRAVERAALWEAASGMATATATVSAAIAAPPMPASDTLFTNGTVDLKQLVAELEQHYIAAALLHSAGVVADAARLLGLQRTTLIEKMNKYGIARTPVAAE
jgi:sigma-54 dependent transcriptional regulator, flagellar regulatory protein